MIRKATIAIILAALCLCAGCCAEEPIDDVTRTLDSLEKIDDYPLYTMHYYGPYPGDSQFGAGDRGDRPDWACSLFAALGDPQNELYGRNFDWEYSPALLLFAHPPDGYASVSMVDLAYLIDPDQVADLTALPVQDRAGLLDAPYLPFDGMNEYGLAVGMAAVPENTYPHDPDAETIGSLGIIREILDHARDVDEAVALLQSHNISFSGGPPIHYLIADASGRAVLVELFQGEYVVIPNQAPYHLATNHYRALVELGLPQPCRRYAIIDQQLEETEGQLTAQEALDLLSTVSQSSTEWSIVYEMHTGAVNVVMDRQYDTIHTLDLPLADD